MGGFWSNVSKTTTGAKRSSLDHARMLLLQQLLAAILNNQLFGSTPSGITIDQAKAAETSLLPESGVQLLAEWAQVRLLCRSSSPGASLRMTLHLKSLL